MIACLGLLVPTALLYWALTPPAARRSPRLGSLYVGLAMGLASGITSCLWFAWQIAFAAPTRGYFACETALLLACIWIVPHLPAPAAPAFAPRRSWTPQRFAVPVLGLLVLTWLTSSTVEWVLHPHGSWDGVAIWNLHARYLVGGGARWSALCRDGAACAYHADYPLLVPAAVARLWSLSGATSPFAGALVGAWFAAATVLLCSGAVGALRGPSQALLTAVTLLGGGFFVRQSASQYADVPLGFFMAAAVAACVLRGAAGGRGTRGWLVVAGLSAGCAAWTKNEGLLFVLTLAAVWGATSLRRAGWRATGDGALALALGALPLLCLVVVFKLAFAPVNDLVAGQGAQASLERLLDPSRYAMIVVGLADAIGRVAKASLGALLLYYLLLGATADRAGRAGARFAVGVCGLMFLGYFATFVLTPQPLAWHLNTAAARLMLQLWPAALIAAFLFLTAPEEALGDASPEAPDR